MRWFKCLDLQSPLMLEAVEAVGKHGAFECLSALAIALETESDAMTEALVSKWAGIKRDRARRLLPFAQAMLAAILESDENPSKISRKSPRNLVKISPESDRNLPEISQKSSENLVDSDPSNPHGSNKLLNTNNAEREKRETVSRAHEEKISEAPVSYGQRSLEVVKALEYLAKADHPNFCNLAWVPGYLENQFDRLAQERPDMPRQAVLQCWLEACDIALAKGNSSPAWMRSVFDRLVTEWTAAKPVTNPQAQRGQMERLAEALESGLRIYNTAREWESFGREEVQLIAPDLVLVSGTERPQSATMFKIRGPDDE